MKRMMFSKIFDEKETWKNIIENMCRKYISKAAIYQTNVIFKRKIFFNWNSPIGSGARWHSCRRSCGASERIRAALLSVVYMAFVCVIFIFLIFFALSAAAFFFLLARENEEEKKTGHAVT